MGLLTIDGVPFCDADDPAPIYVSPEDRRASDVAEAEKSAAIRKLYAQFEIDNRERAASMVAAMAAAKLAYWKRYPDAGFDSFRMVCPGIIGLPSTKVHARYMRATAEVVVENATRAADHRNAAALSLWADEIEAEAQEAA